MRTSSRYLANSTLTSATFANANLTYTMLSYGTLTARRSAVRTVAGADFSTTTGNGFTSPQLYSTLSYSQADLRWITLAGNDLTNWNFAGQNLARHSFSGGTLTGATFSGATVAGADFSAATGFTSAQLYSTLKLLRERTCTGFAWAETT